MSKESKIYYINIPAWEKYNSGKKKNHRCFLIENRFFNDEKIAQLSASETRLYLYLLTVASDLNQSSYTLHTHLIPSYFRLRTHLVHSSLTRLESLQLLSLSKSAPNRIENKRKEENIIEDKSKISNHWFYKFLFEELNYADLGFLNYIPKIEKGFVDESSFRAWLDLLITAQNFQKADLKGQNKYIIKSIKDELISRGIK